MYQSPAGQSWTGIDCVKAWRQSLGQAAADIKLSVVLITHPRDERDFVRLFPSTAGQSAAAIRQMTRGMRAGYAEICQASRIRIGIVFLPLYADDILESSANAALEILTEQGLGAAAEQGAGIVCLGGLTGALSLYGEALEEAASRLGVRVATGHCVTAVSVIRTLRKAVLDVDRPLCGARLALVGLGSVGAAFLRLLVQGSERPAEIVLIDRPGRRRRLEKLRDYAQAQGQLATIAVTEPDGTLTADSPAYRSEIIVSAISSSNVIEISRLRPGTILIDDSQPYCWPRDLAWQRCIERLDIVPCEAGLIDCSSLGYVSNLPFDYAGGEKSVGTAWSCLCEGMLCAVDPDLVPTVGEPALEHLLRFDEAFDRFGLKTPPLQCAPHLLPVTALREKLCAAAGGQS